MNLFKLITSQDWFCGHYSLNGPASFQSIEKSLVAHASTLAPFRKRKSFAIVFNKAIITPVILLLFLCSPPAITWFIVSAIIDPVYGQIRGTFSHITDKLFKYSPSAAYLNSSSAINRILWIVWVSTTLNHIYPNVVRPRFVEIRHE